MDEMYYMLAEIIDRGFMRRDEIKKTKSLEYLNYFDQKLFELTQIYIDIKKHTGLTKEVAK